MKSSPLSQDRLVGFRLAWDSNYSGSVVVVARRRWGSDRCGWLWVAMGGFRSPWIAVGGFRLRVWLWVGLDHVSGHEVVAHRGLPQFARLGPLR